MGRFDNLMDDMKEALILSNSNKTLFLPALFANVALFVIGIIMAIVIVAGVVGSVMSMSEFPEGFNWAMLSGFIIAFLLMFLLIFLLFLALDIGINGMVIGVADGEKPSGKLFMDALKRHFWSVLGTNIGLMVIFFIAFILLFIPLMLYIFTAGILTGGWAMVFLACVMQAFFGFWILIKMEDNRGGFESIRRNMGFARRYFWLMILLVYLQTSFASFLPSLLGLIGAAIASFFISYMVMTYFRMVFLFGYRRYRETI